MKDRELSFRVRERATRSLDETYSVAVYGCRLINKRWRKKVVAHSPRASEKPTTSTRPVNGSPDMTSSCLHGVKNKKKWLREMEDRIDRHFEWLTLPPRLRGTPTRIGDNVANRVIPPTRE